MERPEASPDGDPHADNTIEVVLPAHTDMAATLRVLVASLGADVGFTLDEIDDVRLAVNEVFASVADTDVRSTRRFEASFVPEAATLSISMGLVGSAPLELDQLATTILESVVDRLEITDGRVTIVKHADEANG